MFLQLLYPHCVPHYRCCSIWSMYKSGWVFPHTVNVITILKDSQNSLVTLSFYNNYFQSYYSPSLLPPCHYWPTVSIQHREIFPRRPAQQMNNNNDNIFISIFEPRRGSDIFPDNCESNDNSKSSLSYLCITASPFLRHRKTRLDLET